MTTSGDPACVRNSLTFMTPLLGKRSESDSDLEEVIVPFLEMEPAVDSGLGCRNESELFR